jgi:hypothetical protein
MALTPDLEAQLVPGDSTIENIHPDQLVIIREPGQYVGWIDLARGIVHYFGSEGETHD